MADYVPRPDEKFLDWAKNLVASSLQNFSRWQVPSPQAAIGQLLTDYETAFQTQLDPNHGKIDTVRKNDTRTVLEKAIRGYVAAYLAHNPLVTEEDKAALGIPIYKQGKSPVPAPTTSPQLEPDTGTRRQVLVCYRDEDSNRRGKPKGVRGIDVRWAILDAPPTDLSQLTNAEFDTKAPLAIVFGEADRGKKVFMCGRWEIDREGIAGPWGDVEEAIIP
ncbi:MAG: hypothetical protein Ta2A_10880 [Treponemataceae bacterium]|nr:MAG: hypothetical protein Ta2A_10880 [Treponemataceae bacterium]